MKKTAFLITVLLGMALMGCHRETQPLSVIPVPMKVDMPGGAFKIAAYTPLWIEADEADVAILKGVLDKSPLQLTQVSLQPKIGGIALRVVDALPGVESAEGYVLEVTRKGVMLQALSGAGLYYGVQTMLQMLYCDNHLPYGTIVDEPRFEYRGVMLDVSRHFFDVDFVKKQIDAMARYKFNRLHLHLTDAAGWRIEIKQYPRLTDFAAWRSPALWKDWWAAERHYVDKVDDNAFGGYYTQEQIRDIVDYAQLHHIAVIPEIEMPSHSEEVLAAYPELACSGEPYKGSDFCVGSEHTFTFLENVLLEVMQLFPSEYIHIGGDEASKQAWKECPHCQARMKAEGLADVDELQSYLIRRVETFLNSHGRKLLGWDEILDGGLAPNATVMSWRGPEGGLRAMAMGHRAIMTPGEFCYFDAYQDAPHTQPEAFGGYRCGKSTPTTPFPIRWMPSRQPCSMVFRPTSLLSTSPRRNTWNT